jgi:hypothetical protein
VNDTKPALIWMFLFILVVAALGTVLYPPLQSAFLANRVFNGMILGVLLIGIIINFRQVFALKPDINWIRSFTKDAAKSKEGPQPKMLLPIAKMLTGRNQDGFLMSAMTMRSLLDGIRMRLDESRDISRYFTGLLIFLGLLGTFWGLLDTVTGVANVISNLSATSDDQMSTSFDALIRDLQGPLSGMGTAFSSSLFGLAGALVVGFLDLQSGHAQNRFFNDLEEWLSDLTHLPSGLLGGGETQPTMSSFTEALLEKTAENLDKLQRTVARGEEDRRENIAKQTELTERVAELTDQIRAEQKVILSLSKNQMDMQPAVARLVDLATDGWAGDDEIRQHIRNVDVHIVRVLSEISTGRSQFMDELRDELRLLSHTMGQKQ